MQRLMQARKKAMGFKQSLKAIERGTAQLVFLARDAEDKIRRPILEMSSSKGVPVVEVQTMTELGKAGGIQVATAVAAVLE